mgnify:CR=1 FL=1|jgi:CRISPR-associated endonuclease/helicase Cas3
MTTEFLAHVRDSDKQKQTLVAHLKGVAEASRSSANKLGLSLAGELIGLLHDLGKHSDEFQHYLQSATGLLNPDEDEDYVDANGLKGKVDHSTAGAQLVWKELSKQGPLGQVVGQILALCIASHHSGLIDCLTSDASSSVVDGFTRRMGKPDEKVHLEEALSKVDAGILERLQDILGNQALVQKLKEAIYKINQNAPDRNEQTFDPSRSVVAQFQIGLLVRYLFSCLIDGDRTNSADFEKPKAARHRLNGRYTSWAELSQRLDDHLASFVPHYPIDSIRQDISQKCRELSMREKGIYTLSVPTGGGKTLASLCFALHHAKKHGMDRIVYVIPFTSIIEQNADVARRVLEPANHPEDSGRVVLEHHSNLTPEAHEWREKILTENWDAPVIYTTSVQFLEALFGAGTRGARRMHQLANAVIVFDEIQTLPVRCVHLFNNAINFLVEQCGSTVVLCTATQPLLAHVDKKKGALRLVEGSEIMPDVQRLFADLRRVEVVDNRKPGGWSEAEIVDLVLQESRRAGSCLVVVNTKKHARNLFKQLEGRYGHSLYHLSTSMCPVHRREVLSKVREHLNKKEPIICISTQLIEAGVDVDFGAVIRFAAGLDSIAQAAGRCNRNGSREMGTVHVINPSDENLEKLLDIRIGREKALRVLDDFNGSPGQFNDDLIGPKAMEWYYKNYFFARADDMEYKVSAASVGRDDTLLNLLSVNPQVKTEYERRNRKAPDIYLRQSFMAAGKAFQAIDAPTQGVIVQYEKEGQDLVAELCAAHEIEKQYALLRRAQQYTVNVFPHEFRKLDQQQALPEVQEGTGIRYLDQRYYSKDFGLSTEPVPKEELLNVLNP